MCVEISCKKTRWVFLIYLEGVTAHLITWIGSWREAAWKKGMMIQRLGSDNKLGNLYLALGEYGAMIALAPCFFPLCTHRCLFRNCKKVVNCRCEGGHGARASVPCSPVPGYGNPDIADDVVWPCSEKHAPVSHSGIYITAADLEMGPEPVGAEYFWSYEMQRLDILHYSVLRKPLSDSRLTSLAY